MLEGVRGVDKQVLPFARLFYGQQSQHFWENDSGEVHLVLQGEGSERGDAVMPVVVLTKQHPAFEDVYRSLVFGEYFFAFLRHLCGVKTWEGRSHPRSSGGGSVEAFWDPDPSRKDAGAEPRKDQARRVRHAPGRERQDASRKHEDKSSV